jgi:hypothetical protein
VSKSADIVRTISFTCGSASNFHPHTIYPLLFIHGWVKKGADPGSKFEADPHWTQKSKLEEGFQLAFLV